MSATLFTNVWIFDGSGAPRFPGEVLVEGDHITRVSRTARMRHQRRLPVSQCVGTSKHPIGHRAGSGSHAVSRGDHLAAKGAVVVTFNYRVGAMGYLAHPELTKESTLLGETGASGNYACLDVIAALEWVRRKIAAFGGAPDCVTLFGQSAGAALANVLMASPLATELFQRVIVHSSGRFRGGPMGALPKRLAEAETAGATMAKALGATTLDALRALPPDAIEAPRGFWGPIIDGDVLREAVHTVFARGEQIDVPLLAGHTRHDATPFANPELHSRVKFEAFAYQPWKFASLHAATARRPVSLFNFMQAPPFSELKDPPFHEPIPPAGFGAHHGSELWYVFNTLAQAPWQARESDEKLADAMGSAWLAFARSGNPNVAVLPHWPNFRDGRQAMHLGEICRVHPPFNAPALAFFDQQFSALKP